MPPAAPETSPGVMLPVVSAPPRRAEECEIDACWELIAVNSTDSGLAAAVASSCAAPAAPPVVSAGMASPSGPSPAPDNDRVSFAIAGPPNATTEMPNATASRRIRPLLDREIAGGIVSNHGKGPVKSRQPDSGRPE